MIYVSGGIQAPITGAQTRGQLIVIEGLDAVGKTTTAILYAKNYGAKFIPWLQEPFRTAIRNVWRMQLNGSKISKNSEHLMFLGALRHLSDIIETEIMSGSDVVVDRYYHSTLAVHPPLARHFNETPVIISEDLIGVLKPDCCIQMRLNEQARLLRSKLDAGRTPSPVEILLQTQSDFFNQVRQNLLTQCERGMAIPLQVDGMSPLEVVTLVYAHVTSSRQNDHAGTKPQASQ